MDAFQELLQKYQLSPEEVHRMNLECRAYGAGFGTGLQEDKELNPVTKGDIDDIAADIWSGHYDPADQIELAFQAHELFPASYQLVVGFYRFKSWNDNDDPKIWDRIWQKFCEFLDDEDCIADPILYVLWVDFFESETTVEFAWNGMMAFAHTQKVRQRLLQTSGSVPYPLKEPLIHRMIGDPTNHECILSSLLQWSYDIYGDLDKEKAIATLEKLKVDRISEIYQFLLERLGK